AVGASTRRPGPQVRAAKGAGLAVLTPIIKAMMTDQGFYGSSQALQIYGGHGFITETGIEQYLRDSRIAMIYEGTNEIQAVDLLLRKILSDGGKRLDQFLAQVQETIDAEINTELREPA